MATFSLAEATGDKPSTFTLSDLIAGEKQQDSPGMDVLKSLPSSALRASSGLVGFPQALGDAVDKGATWLTKTLGYDPNKSAIFGPIDRFAKEHLGIDTQDAKPISQQLGIPNVGDVSLSGLKQLAGPLYHDPQTGLGRIADFTAQNMLLGGRSPRQLVQSGAQGLLGGTAGELGRASGIPGGQTIGQILGVAAGGLLPTLRSTPGSIAADAFKDVSPLQMERAQALMDNAAKMGTHLTVAEAIAQATGGNPLQQVQRWVEQSATGKPAFDPIMNARPGNNRAAFTKAADQIAPLPADMGSTPANLAKAGQDALTQARQAGNAAAEPFYASARAQSIPANQWNAIAQDPAVQKALQAVKSNPVWRVTDAKPGSVAWLDAAKKWADDASQTALSKGNNNAATVWGGAAKTITQIADATVPDYAKARSTVARNFRDVVDPMQNSPVGGVADSMPRGTPAESGLAAQSGVMMPPAPGTTTPGAIRWTANVLKKQNPQALPEFTRQNLERIFNEKSQDLTTGEAQGGASRFAADIAGNQAQKDNLKALVESTGGTSAWTGFNRLLEVFQAQGKRLAPNSPTEPNRLMTVEMSQGIGGITKAPLKMLERWQVRSNAEALSNLLTDPTGIQKLKTLAFTNPNSAKQTLLIGEILGIMNPEGDQANAGQSQSTTKYPQ